MKRFALFFIFAALLVFTGCGGGGNDYDKYDDDGDSEKQDDSSDTTPHEDQADTSEEPSDTDADTQPDDDSVTPDEEPEEPDDTDTMPDPDTFWASCEGIIACTNGCADEDSECIGECYGRGNEEGQLYYRRWRECFDNNCAEDQTVECSAEKCAEWDELCNVEEAWDFEINFPAPYGNAEFEGSFSVILGNDFPTSEEEVALSAFAEGKVASMQLAPKGTMITFMRMLDDDRDGKVLEVFQAPIDTTSMKLLNPATILRIKADAAVEGNRTVGFDDDNDARFIVVEMDEKYNVVCHHAFGKGSFTIDGADAKIGSNGWISFNSGTVELYSPENIPELGGDARETLGVEACSLIW